MLACSASHISRLDLRLLCCWCLMADCRLQRWKRHISKHTLSFSAFFQTYSLRIPILTFVLLASEVTRHITAISVAPVYLATQEASICRIYRSNTFQPKSNKCVRTYPTLAWSRESPDSARLSYTCPSYRNDESIIGISRARRTPCGPAVQATARPLLVLASTASRPSVASVATAAG